VFLCFLNFVVNHFWKQSSGNNPTSLKLNIIALAIKSQSLVIKSQSYNISHERMHVHIRVLLVTDTKRKWTERDAPLQELFPTPSKC
jgi:hypothetical protein